MTDHFREKSFGGSIEVIAGPMFSGKTEELIRRVKRAQIAKQNVQIFKPEIDNRYHETKVVSHAKNSIDAIPVASALSILEKVYDQTWVVAIDEVQFFDNEIIAVSEKLARRGIRVILAGLDQDFKGQPFGPMGNLLAIADSVEKVCAICTTCGLPATKTYRRHQSLDTNTKIVEVGEADLYEARCRLHTSYFGSNEERLAFVISNKNTQENFHVD